MKNIYFYPQFDYEKEASPNPYIKDFQNALENNFNIINQQANNRGVLEFFKYLLKADIYLLNWIEDLPLYNFGKLQTFFFIIFLLLVKILNKKIVWVLHNKYSHFTKKNFWTDFMYQILVRYSDFILTHSKDGISFVKDNYPEQAQKVHYFNHPMREEPVKNEKISVKEFDFLIWGTIQPYKGVLEFLNFINNSEKAKNLKILIAGKCFNKDYKKKIFSVLSENVTFKNEFFSLEEIKNMAQNANFILFTHKTVSVLSSGALMDAISMGVRIIGPNNGSFRDLSSLSFVSNYKNYEDIIKLNQSARNESIDFKELKEFYSENTWQRFGENLNIELQKLN